jgi:hypothetical protein
MSLDAIQQALDQFQDGTLDVSALCRRLREQPVPPELAPRFGEVLGNLLDRLESSALFGGESCSFSQEDLAASVQTWIDKARQRLAQS